MKLHLSAPSSPLIRASVAITGSKSESNRLLLLQALYPNISIENLSNSDDARVMKAGLKKSTGTVDIHHAGTAMRFLTGYFATQEGKSVILTGSQRMTERPIKILVEALRQLGADIEYQKNEGFPPLLIKGKRLAKNTVSLPANISSQYISSLLLVAPNLGNGIALELEGEITSVPYLKMTLALLEQLGIPTSFTGNTITVSPVPSVKEGTFTVESDWSSASYFYSIVALSAVGTEIVLSSYREKSLQGDSVLAELYTHFGVETHFGKKRITLKKIRRPNAETVHLDLANAPDLAQTLAVSCFGLGIGCHLTGLHTLKIKETDRLEALHTELSKLGAYIAVTNRELVLRPMETINPGVAIDTYHDHRMAMAFAPLALKTTLTINDAMVVAKSYPDYWTDLEQLGFRVQEV
ncbi:MAG: 3-phosphoshikimate 1-carboxyvinyltransferase [Bacteroidota bacterium]